MDIKKDKYIIVEIIPTRSSKDKGVIAQISALKLEGIKLLDRFDYRILDNLIDSLDVLNMVQYDKKSFTYVDNVYFIIEKFKQWSKGYPLLLLDDTYTRDYFSELDNKMELIYPYLNLEFHSNVLEEILTKYHLEASPHLVDLLYEAIIYEGNNK